MREDSPWRQKDRRRFPLIENQLEVQKVPELGVGQEGRIEGIGFGTTDSRVI